MPQPNMKPSAVFSESNQDILTYIQSINSQLGKIVVGASDDGVRFVKINSNDVPVSENPNEHTQYAARELQAYFDGRLTDFSTIVDITGYSEFSQRVWKELQNIPHGKTISYRDLSEKLGDIKAIRAVGTANGRNPIPIIIPCHRVIGSDGSLTGYALGLDVKKHLLAIENPLKYGLKQMELFE
jgi:methylated-DNA-[protein]-cysteine S-methyltransferase